MTDAIRQMEVAGTGQQATTTGITIDKEAAADHAINLALELAGAAKAYAIDQEDNSLYAQMNLSRNVLDRLAGNELRDKLESILNAVRPLAAQLSDAGVTSQELSEAENALAAYRQAIAAPRTAIAERSASTQSIPQIVKGGRKVLDKMDGLAQRFRRTAPAFVSDYRNARIVVDSGIRHTGGADATARDSAA